MYLTCFCVVWQSSVFFFVCVCVTGLRILEVVFSLSLCSVCLRLQRHQGHVQWFWERDQTGNLKLIYAWFVLTQCCNVVPDVLTIDLLNVIIILHLQFKPLEQLMSVFPAASGNFLPTTWRALMTDPVSGRFTSDFLYMKLHSQCLGKKFHSNCY